MASFNQAIIVGNIGGDLRVNKTKSGADVVNFNVATNKRWTSKDGEKREETTWHRVTCFAKLAEVATRFLHKGSAVMVVGEMRTDEWEKDGEKRYSTYIAAEDFRMLDRKPRGDEADPSIGHDVSGAADEIPF